MRDVICENTSNKTIGFVYSIKPGETLYIVNKRTRKLVRVITYEDVANERVKVV